MFDRISDSFGSIFRSLSGQGAITEANVRDAMAQVRTALLEADVHYEVVESFCAGVVSDALGRKVTESVKPGQEMIYIVHRRLVGLLGGNPDADPAESLAPGAGEQIIRRSSPGPTIVMMCGLQGSGKTTTCGKLAARLKKQGRSVMVCAADLQRPAAIEQLRTVAEQVAADFPGGSQVHFYGEMDKAAAYGKAVGVAVDVCRRALTEARAKGVDVLILDTAGRLHINDELMGELGMVKQALSPQHVFLVVDAMTGQDAVNSAKAFHERLAIDGVIMTKFDSDTRGGAALSVRQVTGAPLRYIGVGEKLDALEEFHAERMAGRILGMGDVVSLVEKAQEEVSLEEAERLQAKMARGELTMDDLLKQMKAMRRMGPLKNLMGLLPGVGSMMKDVDIDEKQLDRTEAMILSMTPEEKKKPGIIQHARRKRIARGSGTNDQQVGALVKQFDMLSKVTRTLGSMSTSDRVAAAKALQGIGPGGGGGGGFPGLPGRGSTVQKAKGFKQRKRR